MVYKKIFLLVLEVPTLGQSAFLGQIYSAQNGQFIPGFSLWEPNRIKKTKRTVWNPKSSLSFHTDVSEDDKYRFLNVQASIKGSFLGGLLKVSGSADYLKTHKV